MTTPQFAPLTILRDPQLYATWWESVPAARRADFERLLVEELPPDVDQADLDDFEDTLHWVFLEAFQGGSDDGPLASETLAVTGLANDRPARVTMDIDQSYDNAGIRDGVDIVVRIDLRDDQGYLPTVLSTFEPSTRIVLSGLLDVDAKAYDRLAALIDHVAEVATAELADRDRLLSARAEPDEEPNHVGAAVKSYLEGRGWSILDTDWTYSGGGLRGGLDIVARDSSGTLVIVVLTSESAFAAAVTPARVAKLRALTSRWLHEREGSFTSVRIDQASATRLPHGATVLEYRSGVA